MPKLNVLKKILIISFLAIFFSSCRSISPIITTRSDEVKPKNAVVLVENTTIPAQKKVREPEKVVVSKKAYEKLPDLPYEIDDEFIVNPPYNGSLSEEIVASVKENLGSKYRTGGTSKPYFDCSGLVYSTFNKFDIKLPRTSNEMSRFGTKINPKDAKIGDLIFFKTLGNKQINHVGMIVAINDDEIKFVHASIKQGVIISTTKEGYYKNTFAQINRVVE